MIKFEGHKNARTFWLEHGRGVLSCPWNISLYFWRNPVIMDVFLKWISGSVVLFCFVSFGKLNCGFWCTRNRGKCSRNLLTRIQNAYCNSEGGGDMENVVRKIIAKLKHFAQTWYIDKQKKSLLKFCSNFNLTTKSVHILPQFHLDWKIVSSESMLPKFKIETPKKTGVCGLKYLAKSLQNLNENWKVLGLSEWPLKESWGILTRLNNCRMSLSLFIVRMSFRQS